MSETQNFENHGKIVPAFHFFVLPVFAFELGIVDLPLRAIFFF